MWFEPTEVRKAKKILQVPKDCWGGLRYMSPNLGELMTITGIDVKDDLSKETSSSGTNNPSTFDLQQLPSLFSRCFQMFLGLEVILFTRGKDGILVLFLDLYYMYVVVNIRTCHRVNWILSGNFQRR